MRQEVNGDRRSPRRARRGAVRARLLVAIALVLAVAGGGAAWVVGIAATPRATPVAVVRSDVRVEGSSRVDLGVAPFDEAEPAVLEHEIVLRNHGGVPIAVEEMAFGCGCLSAPPELGEVPPGGTWSKRVEMRVDRPGRHGASVYLVLSDGSAIEVALTVDGRADAG